MYSDQEIFLRELISNAIDASQKLKTLSAKGEFKGEIGDDHIEVLLDNEAKTLTIRDSGIGMTKEEVEKYINQIAFSSAQEFLEKYDDANSVIGHFGLGFYSAFMVADKVEIITQSWQDAPAVRWECEGQPEYKMSETERPEGRGTDIVLHINEEGKAYLENYNIENLLHKYCRFLPIPIQFGTQEVSTGLKDEEENDIMKTVPKFINDTKPAWTKKPVDLTDEDYLAFYKQLYPYNDDPLFWIHLNVDYPFKLTGILYFPELKKNIEVKQDQIQLYSNQVFVTNHVEEIVPAYLMLLHGVIDSPDIPLNVSRSYLQSDPEVKKINKHISKKVADKLEELFKKERETFEDKWHHISVLIKYGILLDEKFKEKAMKFCLFESTDETYHSIDEYKEKIKDNQTDKNGTLVILYANDKKEHHSFIEAAKSKSYDVFKV